MMLRPHPNKIRQLRMRQGLSQHKLSLKAGLSGCSICRIEKGDSLSVNHLRAKEIAAVLGCKVEDIFTPTKGV